jgi:hypothetical protein
MSTQVLTRNHRIYSDTAFAATLGPANIPVDHIIELDYDVQALEAGTTQVVSDDLKALVNEVVMNLGGREIVRLDNHDVLDLDNLWFGQTPQSYLTLADNAVMQLGPYTIPLSLDKSLGGQLRTLDVQFTYGTLDAHIDTPLIFAHTPYLSNKNASWLPGGFHYAYQYRSFIPCATAQHLNFPRKGADLIGLLVYNANPSTTNRNTDVDWLTIYVNDQPVYGPVYWETMRTFQGTQSLVDDTDFGTETWHYRYLDFSKAPLPADFLDVETASVTNVTGPDRLIGVYIEP